jgi:hypothetical protein
MSELGLCSMVEALIGFTEVLDAPVSESQNNALECLKPQLSSTIKTINLKIKSSLSVSRASVAWFEMLLVEISLRNRDRFGAFWPLLSAHYSRVLIESSHITMSYVTERFLEF